MVYGGGGGGDEIFEGLRLYRDFGHEGVWALEIGVCCRAVELFSVTRATWSCYVTNRDTGAQAL